MQTAAVVVTSLLLAAGTSAGVTYAMQSPEPPVVSQGSDGELQARIDSLEAALEKLQSRSIQSNEVRRSLDPVSSEDIDAAVARYLAKHPVASGGKPAAKVSKRNLSQTFLHLQGDLSDTEFAEVWKQLRESGQMESMVKMFEDAAANSPNDPDAQTKLGVAYLMKVQGMTPGMESGKVATLADQVFDKALKLNPKHWDARFLKAQALSFWPPMFGKQAVAIDEFETLRKQQESAPESQPQFARTYLFLGNLYSQQGNDEKAMEAWKQGATRFPRHEGLAGKLGK